MTRTAARAWLRAAALGLLVVACGVVPSAPAAKAQQPAPPRSASPALEEYGACLAGAGSGDLLLLLDQSGSLRDTDPRDQRVVAARLLLEQLSASAAAAGLALDVSIAGFDADYREASAWRRLDGGSLPALLSDVEGFRDRDRGIDTDYWNALEGSRRSLRAKAAGKTRCQAVVWLTDGAFDVAARRSARTREAYDRRKPYAPDADLTTEAGAAAALTAGRSALCEQRGLADQLRVSGVKVLAVGLQAEAAAGDFAFVQQVATGTGPGGVGRCGAPTKAAVGDFRLAADLDDVVSAFMTLAHPGTPPREQTKKVCPRTACVAQAHGFVLDESISTVTVLARASDPGIDVSLQPPGAGAPVVFRYDAARPSGSSAVGTSKVLHRWVTERSLSLVLQRGNTRSWTGAWSVTFVDPTATRPAAVSRTQISLEGDIVPAWPDRDTVELRAGEVAKGVVFGLASETGGRRVAPETLLGTGELVVALRGRGGVESTLARLPVKAAGRPVDLDLRGVDSGALTLRLRLSLTTAGIPAAPNRPIVAGTTLADKVVDLSVTALPPLGFPRASSDVNFGQVEGDQSKRARLELTGPGCVWLKSVQVTALPNGSGDARVSSAADGPGSCVEVGPGGTAALPLSIRLDRSGNGAVGGELVLAIAPAGAPERALEQRVPFLADAQKPLEAATAVGAFVVALLLGLGLPVLFLYGLAWWTARIPPVGLLAGLVPVTLDGGQVQREGRPFEVGNSDVEPVPVAGGGGREVRLPDGLVLRTKVSPAPGEGGFVLLEAPGRTSTAGRAPHTTRDGARARLPLAVHNSWSLVHDPATGRSSVLVLAVSTAKTQVFLDLTSEVRREAPALLAKLRAEAGGETTGTDQSGGSAETWFAGAGAAAAPAARPDWFGGGAAAPPPVQAAPSPSTPPVPPPASPSRAVEPPPAPPAQGDWFRDGAP